MELRIVLGHVEVMGDLEVPIRPKGLVIFAHGSGSSRKSPRNGHVAGILNRKGYATFIADLLTPVEEQDRDNAFDVATLGARLIKVTEWLRNYEPVAGLPVAYFGASTGAAAALVAVANGTNAFAVVGRGGRPDLALVSLGKVDCPVLLMVGEKDPGVIELNERARKQLRQAELEVVPGADHLFKGPGQLEQVVTMACDWFDRHLPDRHNEVVQHEEKRQRITP